MSEPCRLCGSEPEIATYYDFYRFNCPTEGCGERLDNGKVVNGIGMWYGSIAEARDAWNQRQRREETTSATQTAEPEPEPAREGDEPQIGEIAWHREVLDGHHPSDCPYCGCERVVVGDYEPYHDDEWDYHIEHKNPREAIERGCFEMYAAFKTPEDAVRGADMRATEWVIPINDDTMRVLSDVCREKPKRQLRAEAIERLRKACSIALGNQNLIAENRELHKQVDSLTAERDELRKMAAAMSERGSAIGFDYGMGLGLVDAARMIREAADTIESLRDRLQDAEDARYDAGFENGVKACLQQLDGLIYEGADVDEIQAWVDRQWDEEV